MYSLNFINKNGDENNLSVEMTVTRTDMFYKHYNKQYLCMVFGVLPTAQSSIRETYSFYVSLNCKYFEYGIQTDLFIANKITKVYNIRLTLEPCRLYSRCHIISTQ